MLQQILTRQLFYSNLLYIPILLFNSLDANESYIIEGRECVSFLVNKYSVLPLLFNKTKGSFFPSKNSHQSLKQVFQSLCPRISGHLYTCKIYMIQTAWYKYIPIYRGLLSSQAATFSFSFFSNFKLNLNESNNTHDPGYDIHFLSGICCAFFFNWFATSLLTDIHY